MNESPQPSLFRRKEMLVVFGLLFVVVAVFGLVIMQLGSHVDELSDKVSKAEKQKNTAAVSYGPTDMIPLESGKKGFTMTVPASFGTLLKETGSDMFIMPGMEQPELAGSNKSTVKDIEGYGTDNASLFIVLLSEEGMSDTPMGKSEEFTIGKGDDMLVGKKYSYVYPEDTIEGIGYMRHQNDRRYQYAFTTKDGKKLDVIYSVYGSDPRNLVTTVDSIVQSIVVK